MPPHLKLHPHLTLPVPCSLALFLHSTHHISDSREISDLLRYHVSLPLRHNLTKGGDFCLLCLLLNPSKFNDIGTQQVLSRHWLSE